MTDFNSDCKLTTPKVAIEHLKSIAESGNVDIDWHELQETLEIRLCNILEDYNQRKLEVQNEDRTVEEFNLEGSRDELLGLIRSFDEPPFTIQRICELLYSPFDYYDRVCTFIRGLEKNLRVISSNNWPKSSSSGISDSTSSNTNNDSIQQSSMSQDITEPDPEMIESHEGEEEAEAEVVEGENNNPTTEIT